METKIILETASQSATVIGVFLALIGLFFTYQQIKIANDLKRAEYVIKLNDDYRSDKDMIEIYYKIEYSEFKYNQNTFHSSEDEKKLDKLLEYFSHIGKLYFRKILKESDLDFITYRLLIVYQNPEVKKYLDFLAKWFETRNITNGNIKDFENIGKYLENKNKPRNPDYNRNLLQRVYLTFSKIKNKILDLTLKII